MLELKVGAFYYAVDRLSSLSSWITATGDRQGSTFDEKRELEEIDRTFALSRFLGLPNHLEVLGARVAAMAAQEAQLILAGKDVTWGQVLRATDDVRNTMKRELHLTKTFAISAERQRYFDPTEPLFGPDVAAKFLSAAYEIEEAGKCLALDRSTASAFHSIRCLEAGIRALSRCLNIPDPIRGIDRSWGNILRSIKTEIDRRWPVNSIERLTPDAKLFEKTHAALAAMMNPWRNETMHLEGKYTESEAQHIFEVVKGFMMVVASRCDEMGEPKA